MSTSPLSRPTSTRTKAGHAVGVCPGCGYGMADTQTTHRACPSCGAAVVLAWVLGERSDEPCDGRCINAVGPSCSCACGGANHGSIYLEFVPQWVRERDAKRHQDKTDRAEAQRRAGQSRREAARAELLDRYPVLAWLSYRTNTGEAWDDGSFMTDMTDAFQRGKMSDRQAAAAVRAIERETERRTRRAAEEDAAAAARAAGVRVSAGVQVITGKVVHTRWDKNRFAYSGGCLKMLVVTDAGCKIWGTCPAALSRAADDADLRGSRVQFTAEVTPSADDPMFGTFKRPRRAGVLAPTA